MDDSQILIVRNAELETELRIVKEQLSQANSTNLYLLNQISLRVAQHEQAKAGRESCAEKRVETKEDHQNSQAFTSAANRRWSLKRGSTNHHGLLRRKTQVLGPIEKHRRYGNQLKPLVTESKKHSSPKDDLLVFNAEDRSAASSDLLIDISPEAPAVPATSVQLPKSPHVKVGCEQPRGCSTITIRGLDFAGQTHIAPDLQPPFHNKSGFSTEIGKSVEKFMHTSPSHFIGSRPVIEAGPRLLFTDNEHNRLMGAACFIETQSTEEQCKHWAKYAKQNPRHSERDWQNYYELLIRPAYYGRTHGVASENTNPLCAQAESMNSIPTEGHNSVDLLLITDDERKEGSPDPLLQYESIEAHLEPEEMQETSRLAKDGSTIGPSRSSAPIPSSDVTNTASTITKGAEGLFYSPSQPKDHHRTVLLLNVLQSTTKEVIERYDVPRAKLLRASLLRTGQMKTIPLMNTDTALLVFVTAQAAKAFVNATNRPSEIQEASKRSLDCTEASAVLIETPSRILPFSFTHIPTDRNRQSFLDACSNVVSLHDGSKELVDPLQLDASIKRLRSVAHDLKKPICSRFTEDGALLLEYPYVLPAKRAYDSLYWSFARHSERRIGFWKESDNTVTAQDE